MEPERCAECGFDGTRLTIADAITALRSIGPRWRRLFEDVPEETLRTRPAEGVWSPLEYTLHTRDVIADNAVEMAAYLEGRQPEPADFEARDYEDEEPDVSGGSPETLVARLTSAADAMADRAQGVPSDSWERKGRPDGPDAGWTLRHAVHDATHHLQDVERGITKLTGDRPREDD